MFSWLPWVRRRRRELLSTPLPEAWTPLLERNVPHVARLDPEARARLEGLVQLFLDDKSFEGLGGLEMTDEIRVTIAAQACILLLGLEVDWPYPGLDVIRVYPGSYRVPVSEGQDAVMTDKLSHRLGESSTRGYVVLSWRDARRGGRDPDDGQNVVLHEFAHQLDTQDGVADGAPPLPGTLYGPWAKILSEAFDELEEDVAKRRRGVIDSYGATNPAEFFAVATEHFFEEPRKLRRRWPDVYDVLARYYRQNPAER